MHQQIIPMLSYKDGVAAMDWLCRVFGFTENMRMLDGGRLAHGELKMGECIVMLAEPTPHYEGPALHAQHCAIAARWSESPYIINGVLVYVDDVEAHFKIAEANGAQILSALEYGFPGTRYRAADLEGQRWMFMQAGS